MAPAAHFERRVFGCLEQWPSLRQEVDRRLLCFRAAEAAETKTGVGLAFVPAIERHLPASEAEGPRTDTGHSCYTFDISR